MRTETKPADSTRGNTLRVMTWNVHSCIGPDQCLSVDRVARVIAGVAPDIVALQELGEARASTDGEHQAREIAHILDMDCQFYPVINNAFGKYGIATLSCLPMRLVKAEILPGISSGLSREPRGVLWIAAMINGMEIQVLNTHFGLSPRGKLLQAQALLGDEWIANPLCRNPVILCGDFNALPLSRVCRNIRHALDDVQRKMANHQPRGTYPSRLPLARIDHIFVDAATLVSIIQVPKSPLTRSASDHLPLIADLVFSP